jgi:hypothetical protein
VVRIRSGLDSKQSSCSQAAQSSGLGCGVVNTTATSAAAGGVDQLGQELAAPSRQTQTQHTQEHTRTHSSSTVPQFHQHIRINQQPPWSPTEAQDQAQEEKDKGSAASPGGEGQARS